MKGKCIEIPDYIFDMPLSIEAIGLLIWLSVHADQNGQIFTSRADLSKRTGLSQQQIRTAVEKLTSTKLVTKLATKLPTKFATTLTISFLATCEAEKNASNQVSNQVDNQVINQVSRVYKNNNIIISYKENNNEDNNNNDIINKKEKENIIKKKKSDAPDTAITKEKAIEERQKKFYQTIIPYLEKYPKEMLRDFYNYWSETNRSKTKMRVELQQTWDLAKRLATWYKKTEERKFNNGNDRKHSTAEERAAEAAAIIARLDKEADNPDKPLW